MLSFVLGFIITIFCLAGFLFALGCCTGLARDEREPGRTARLGGHPAHRPKLHT